MITGGIGGAQEGVGPLQCSLYSGERTPIQNIRANQCYLTDGATQANRITFVRSLALVRSTRVFTVASRRTYDE